MSRHLVGLQLPAVQPGQQLRLIAPRPAQSSLTTPHAVAAATGLMQQSTASATAAQYRGVYSHQQQVSDDDKVYHVWQDNLSEAVSLIRDFVDEYSYLFVDTVFPGDVLRPITHEEYHYMSMKVNIDIVPLIQLGITFTNSRGEKPRTAPATFQFNFHISLAKDVHDRDIVAYLAQQGVNFNKHESDGVDHNAFASLMTDCGIIGSDYCRWVTYFGAFDLGFMLKTFTDKLLPATLTGFKEDLKIYFPKAYDLKAIIQTSRNPTLTSKEWTLRELCDHLGIPNGARNGHAGLSSIAISQAFSRIVGGGMFDLKLDESLVLQIGGLDAMPSITPPGSSRTVSPMPAKAASAWAPPPGGVRSAADPLTKRREMPAGQLPPGMLRIRPSQISSFVARAEARPD